MKLLHCHGNTCGDITTETSCSHFARSVRVDPCWGHIHRAIGGYIAIPGVIIVVQSCADDLGDDGIFCDTG